MGQPFAVPMRSTIGEGVYREFAGSLHVCKVCSIEAIVIQSNIVPILKPSEI